MDTLTHEQLTVLYELSNGKNVGLLGAAGCGKSYLLSVICKELPGIRRKMNPNDDMFTCRIQMCALTGCAALLLGNSAKTLHSWAGIGLGKGTVDELCQKIRKNSKARKNWQTTDLLIIDEVSMLVAELLDKLDAIAKNIRKSAKPFGGIQLLLVGDFYQLPPISKGIDTVFAFESATWKEVIHCCIELTIIQRQKDPVFQQIVKEARVGQLSKESAVIIKECMGRDWQNQKIRPTLIFPRRAEVDMINDSNLKALMAVAPLHTYKAKLVYDDVKRLGKRFSEQDEQFQRVLTGMDNDAAYLVELDLILDAQVMMIANIDPTIGLVNGSRGVIVGFSEATGFPVVEFMNGVRRPVGPHVWPIDGYEFVSRGQIPLRLGFAATTHKCQGASLDSALVDLGSGNFEFGQAYVALSRVRSLEALYVHDFTVGAFRAHPKVVEFYKSISLQKMDEKMDWVAWIKDVSPTIKDVSPTIKESMIAMFHKQDASSDDEEKSQFIKDPKEFTEKEPITQMVLSAPSVLTPSSTNWLYDSVPIEWKECLSTCEEKLGELSTVLSTKTFLPSRECIWAALTMPMSAIRVVILGQDPYPTLGNAHGLAFSVLPDVAIPASLKNIYKEMVTDLAIDVKGRNGNLEHWAKQGVLLLNTVLTVEEGAPQSHSKLGWEQVTDQVIRSIAAQTTNVVFVLWGKSAQSKKGILGLFAQKHRIFESPHPSPLSASRGFFGSKPFSTVNAWLTKMGKQEITW